MQTTQHSRCPVLLHPACTTNPDAVRAVQQATGRLIVIKGGKPQLREPRTSFWFASGRTEFLSGELNNRRFKTLVAPNSDPFGGDAA